MTSLFDISWGFLALAAWGVADYLARGSAVRIGSLSASLLIQALGALLPAVLLVAEWAIGGPPEVDWGTLSYAVPLTSFLMAMAYTIYYMGMERGSVSIVTGVASAWMLVTVLIAVVAFQERVTPVQGLVIVVILAGIVLISSRPTMRHGGPSGFGYGLVAMLFMGSAFAMWKPISEAGSPLLAVFLVRVVSSAVVFVFLRLRRGPLVWPSSGASLGILLSAAFLDALGFVAYIVGVDRAPLVIIAPLGAASPLATILLAMLLLHERPLRLQVLGIGLTVLGVIVLSTFTGG